MISNAVSPVGRPETGTPHPHQGSAISDRRPFELARVRVPMSFPLGDWVLFHPDVPHNLAISGMRDSLPSLPAVLRTAPPSDPVALRSQLGRLHGVAARRVFLTHGASEANALILLFLARELRRGARLPRIHTPTPEYPPIADAAVEVGFARAPAWKAADAVALSSPRNPLGTSVPIDEVRRLAGTGRPVLVDQTFREFTDDPAASRTDIENLWLSGSYTKVYGADELRVGYAIAPDEQVEGFARLHGLFLDRLPARSVSGALAILANRSKLLGEARGLLRANERYLKSHVDGVPDLAAPVWFDRGRQGFDGDRAARRLLRHGVLVCAGSFFGDPRGVRIALTRRSFPEDLDAYLRWVDRS